jgi:TolB-like protein
MKKFSLFPLLPAVFYLSVFIGCAPYYTYNRDFKLLEPIAADTKIIIDAPASISGMDVYQKIVKNLQDDLSARVFDGNSQSDAPALSVAVEISELEYTCQPWGVLWFTYTLFGVPGMRHVGTAGISVTLSTPDNRRLARYSGRGIISQWSGLFYGHENRHGVVIMAASEAMTRIKYQIEEDKPQLVKAIAEADKPDDTIPAGVDDTRPIDTISIAVLPLEGENVSRDQVNILTSRLSSQLLKSGVFRLVERQEMETILKEQGFQQAGCTSSRCAVEIGQIVNVEQIVAGSVGYTDGLWVISLRMIDVGNGRIVKTSETETEGSFKEVLRGALADAARKLAR